MELEIDPTLPGEHLREIWGRLPADTLALEEARLRETYAELGGKIIAIGQVREAKQYGQRTLFAEDPQ